MTDISTFDDSSPRKNVFRRFTRWVPWEERNALVDPDGWRIGTYGGVYLFADFAKPPAAEAADHLDPAIFYVGESKRFSLRWYQHQLFTTALRRRGSRPHVAALPIWFGDDPDRSDEPWTQDFRLYVERRVIWEITAASDGTRRLLNRR